MNHLSASAVGTLRIAIKGYRRAFREQDRPAYVELAEAGLMEPCETGYRFTPWGLEHREAILERESDRIEAARMLPPDAELSDAARSLLRRIVTGRVDVQDADRPAFRELAAARVIWFGSSFALGPESAYRLTYWGYHRRFELSGLNAEVA